LKRRLTLRSEHLAELSPSDLGSVVGGQVITKNQGICASLVPTQCCTGYYPSINAPCDTAAC
jgi:hypothetical protein